MNYKSVWLGLVLTVMTTLGFAKGPKLEFHLELLETRAFSMNIKKARQGVSIYFLNKEGDILFQNHVNKGEGFGKTYDLEHLNNGQYQLRLIDNEMVQVLVVELKEGKLQLDLDNSRYYYIPMETSSQGGASTTVRINAMSSDPMKMMIENKTGRILYSGKVQGSPYGINISDLEDSGFVINSDGIIAMKGQNL